MARYCFYCGRELQTGEKCNCRHHQKTDAQQDSEQKSSNQQTEPKSSSAGKSSTRSSKSDKSGRKKPKSESQPKPDVKAKSGFHAFADFWFGRFTRKKNNRHSTENPYKDSNRQSRKNNQTGHQDRQTHSGDSPFGRASRRTASPDFGRSGQNAAASARKIALYLIQPADQIREVAAQRSRQPVIKLILFQSIVLGLILMAATQQKHLGTVLSLNIASAQQGESAMTRLFLFVQGTGIGAAGFLLHVLIYQLLLRYVFRQPLGFRQLLTGLSASCFFSGLFLLGSLMFISGSFFSALMMMMVAFAVAVLSQFIALSELCSLDENRIILLCALAALILSSFIALFLNLSVPILNILLEQSFII